MLALTAFALRVLSLQTVPDDFVTGDVQSLRASNCQRAFTLPAFSCRCDFVFSVIVDCRLLVFAGALSDGGDCVPFRVVCSKRPSSGISRTVGGVSGGGGGGGDDDDDHHDDDDDHDDDDEDDEDEDEEEVEA